MTVECPLPEVQVALAPYIRTRQEALLIRQRLTAYLQSHVQHASDQEPTHMSVAVPASTLEARNIPSEVSGLRRQYLEALEANVAARNQRDQLQSELRELHNDHIEECSDDSRNKDLRESAATYTELLRQRKRLSRLQILQAGIEELVENAPELAHKDLKTLIDEVVGISPDPPSLTLEVEAQDPIVEELTFKLKKELLIAKRELEKTRHVKEQEELLAHSNGATPLETEVAALRVARDELVTWIEGELTKIGEESEIQNFSSPTKHAQDTGQVAPDTHHEQMQELYSIYLERRREFVAVVDTATTEFNKQRTKQSSQQPRQSTLPLKKSETPGSNVFELIPNIPALIAISRTESDLQQQLAHLRRQITFSTEETLRSLRRLADESHLVPPRSDSVHAWIHAAGDNKKETEDAVEKDLLEGEKSLEQAQQALKALQDRRQNFSKIKGDVLLCRV